MARPWMLNSYWELQQARFEDILRATVITWYKQKN